MKSSDNQWTDNGGTIVQYYALRGPRKQGAHKTTSINKKKQVWQPYKSAKEQHTHSYGFLVKSAREYVLVIRYKLSE